MNMQIEITLTRDEIIEAIGEWLVKQRKYEAVKGELISVTWGSSQVMMYEGKQHPPK